MSTATNGDAALRGGAKLHERGSPQGLERPAQTLTALWPSRQSSTQIHTV
jgi:hypothetical protein